MAGKQGGWEQYGWSRILYDCSLGKKDPSGTGLSVKLYSFPQLYVPLPTSRSWPSIGRSHRIPIQCVPWNYDTYTIILVVCSLCFLYLPEVHLLAGILFRPLRFFPCHLMFPCSVHAKRDLLPAFQESHKYSITPKSEKKNPTEISHLLILDRSKGAILPARE